MSLKLKHRMIFLVIALCALIGIASAAGGGTGGIDKTEIALFGDGVSIANIVDDVDAIDDEEEIEDVDDAVDNEEEVGDDDDAVDDEEEVGDDEECGEDEECDETVKPVDTSIEGQLLAAAEKLSVNWSAAEIEEAMASIYKNVNGVVMVYAITPKGVVEAVYPDKYNAAVGDFIGRSPVGGILMKAREFTKTDEYTSAREKISGYDAIQPIISSDDEYLGAIVAKFSS